MWQGLVAWAWADCPGLGGGPVAPVSLLADRIVLDLPPGATVEAWPPGPDGLTYDMNVRALVRWSPALALTVEERPGERPGWSVRSERPAGMAWAGTDDPVPTVGEVTTAEGTRIQLVFRGGDAACAAPWEAAVASARPGARRLGAGGGWRWNVGDGEIIGRLPPGLWTTHDVRADGELRSVLPLVGAGRLAIYVGERPQPPMGGRVVTRAAWLGAPRSWTVILGCQGSDQRCVLEARVEISPGFWAHAVVDAPEEQGLDRWFGVLSAQRWRRSSAR